MTFLLSNFSREVMTSKRLSIHISNDNIYTFMIDQQNENTAFIPKKFTYRNTFGKYISGFLPAFSMDDVKK